MTLEDITEKVSEINLMGKHIVSVSEQLFALPEDIQPLYADQLLDIISIYYSSIDILKKDVVQYRNEEKVSNLTIKKLEKDLQKFNKL